MHPNLLQELNQLHIQDLHRGPARTRFRNPVIRRFRVRTTATPATLAKNPREYGSHA